ncbi:phage antirepressor KilAC domain-containing protein [Macrococcoides bohemicum]|uniref:Phage antirepressor KilAC domain-containing protein n=1 Tax=Macrococcoides bohemicum TaxID=1903056 RepID=A0AAJ4P7U3_9STAP|nr:phage antirepressor KilAC domain-containing protein [Macrococcus bohemicus]QYA42098.1 phage antirepressor KilAC domain-containing protein [Macrococcus bohemicus]
MKNLQVVKEQELLSKRFRIYGDFENPLFLAKDVAEWIEHSKVNMMLQSIDEEEKLMETLFTSGQNRQMWFLTEDGLYEVLMQSRKPIAKQFKKEVKAILKSVRKHGAYMTSETIENVLTDPDTIIKLATTLKEEQLKRQQAELQVQKDRPKVLFAEAVSESNSSISVADLAKILKQNGIDIGQNRLFEYLRNNGFLIKRKGTDYNAPTQHSLNLGLFSIKETVVHNSSGNPLVRKTTKVTGKGQQYFINKFLVKTEAVKND